MTETTKVQKTNIDQTAIELHTMKQHGLWNSALADKLYGDCLELPKMPGKPNFDKLDARMDEGEKTKTIEFLQMAFWEAWEAAWKTFTGTGSFTALLYTCYFRKKKGCEADYFQEFSGQLDQKMKERAVKRALKSLAKEKGIKLELSKTNINFLNLDRVEAFALEKGLIDTSDPSTREKELDKLRQCIFNDYVLHDEVVSEDGESIYLSDAISVAAFHGQAELQDDYSFGGEFEPEEHYRIAAVQEQFKSTKMSKILKMVLTFGAFRKEDKKLASIAGDKDFYAFLCENKAFDNPTDAIIAFKGGKRETVRKDVREVYLALCPQARVAKTSAN